MNRSLAVGATVATLLVAGAVVAVAAPGRMSGSPHEFTITFPTASGLVSGSDVLEAGSKVGTISDIKPLQGDRASLTVSIDDDHWPLHQGLQADIRPKSLLGEKYVDLHDGAAKNPVYDVNAPLNAGGDSVPVELDQFINSLDTDTRSALRVLLNDLGAGIAGRGVDLNQAIQTGRDDLAHLAVTGQTLNNRDPDLDRILVGLDGLFAKLTQDDQLNQMSQLIDNGKATLDAVEAEQAAFSRSFSDAERALAEANMSFDSVISNLRGTLDVAPHLLANVHDESSLLATAAAASLAPNAGPGSPALSCGYAGCQVDMLAHSIMGGPYTTGGAQEWVTSQPGATPSQVFPIFRVCLGTPQGFNPPSSSNPTPSTATSCSGTPSAKAASLAMPYTGGGGGDMAMLAGFLGV
jgi:phospholipid/cholesterol/gamma-HCH transport system substrate-binding protein